MLDNDPLTLAVEEARYAVVEQAHRLTELRNRVGIVVSTASLVLAFFGPTALVEDPGPAAAAAVVAFVLLVVAAILVFMPRRGWKLTWDPTAILDWVDESGLSDEQVQRQFAMTKRDNYLHNEDKLKWLCWAFTGSVVLLGAVVLLLAVELAGR